MTLLTHHNLGIDCKTGEVKITRCLEEYRKQWRPKQGKPEQQKQKEEEQKEKAEKKTGKITEERKGKVETVKRVKA